MENTQVTLACAVCGQPFRVKAYRATTAKFCSKACWAQRHQPDTRTCPTCRRTFETYQRTQTFCSRSCARSGTPGNAYKDGRSLERERARLGPDLKAWRAAVFARDAHTCQQCGATGAIHAHHVQSWANHPELRLDISNGVTLCAKCHGSIHGKDFSARRHKTCPDCGSPTTGRGIGGRCRSCAITAWHRSRSTSA